MSERLRLSAVVPVLDEATALPGLLRALVDQVDQCVVVDGGSQDGTPDLARRAGAEVLTAPRGRGQQLHAGAGAATGDVLWFVHADTTVPSGAGEALRRAAAEGPWGCFAVRIDAEDPRLRLASWGMTLRARWTGSCTGDMGIWARRGFYEDLGGFAALAAFEDLDFSDRACRQAPAAVLGPPLGTSARRWRRRGTTRTVAEMWALRLAYRLGVPPERLARRYRSTDR